MPARIHIASACIVLVAIATGVYTWHTSVAHTETETKAAVPTYKTPAEAQSVYTRFVMEAYDDIADKYWQKTSDADLSQLFSLSISKAAATSTLQLATSTRAGVAQMFAQALVGLSTTSARDLALKTITVVLYNLAPVGRDQILSREAQSSLTNTVENVHPEQDLYSTLGLQKGATLAQVNTAFTQKQAELAATTSQEGKAALSQVAEAHAVLSNPLDKTIYDQTGAQPTVFVHQVNQHTLYIYISQIAPTTITEFASAINNASTTPNLTNLIIDVRGNIGGDLSFAQEFLALFFGPNQYGFDLFHQGDLTVQRTASVQQAGAMTRFKEIAVLTDEMSQSTAEVMASALKHDRLAYTVGTTTRGWGSVEQIVPMGTPIDTSESYALEMVSYLTVRYDGLPIEGNGVVPDVAVSDPHWKSALANYFASPDMITAIQKMVTQAPLK
ncbi:MAG TPA: S41 family peptidase [Candidatus Paceibacterota bacterium]|nr:S41 family peptidase [Candidatus Paceibacterota bacterium]